MEDSDSSDNENDTLVKHRRQRERLAREEAFYRFVNRLSNEDYKLMRDNNLLGAIGEKTEEELQRSLQRIKESIQIPGFYPNYFMPTIQPRTFNSPGGRPPIHDVQHSVGSVTNQVSSFFRQPEPMTGREQRVNRSCTATSENNLNTSDTELRMNSYLRTQRQAANTQSDSIFSRPSRAEASVSEASTEVQPPASQEIESNISTIIRKVRARPQSSSSSYSQNEILWRVHNPENIQKQTHTETDVTFPGSQLNTTISSMNTLGTSGQRRERNRSPELQRVRARNEESSPSNSQSQIQRKVHNTGKTYRRTANSQSETTSVRPSTSEVTAAETSMDILPSRIQRRTRSTSPVHRRVKPRIEGSLPPNNASSENSRVNEAEMSSSIPQHEALTGQTTGCSLCIKQLLAGLTATNDRTAQTDSNRSIRGESCIMRPSNQTPDSNSEVSFNTVREHSLGDNIANRSQVTPQTTSNTSTLGSGQVSRTLLSNTEQSRETACIRTTVSTQSKVHLNNATLVITHRTLCQIMVEFDPLTNHTNNDSDTENDTDGNNDNDTDRENEDSHRDESEVYCYSDFEHSDSFVIDSTESENTESERDYESDESEIYASNLNPDWDSYNSPGNSESSLIASYNSSDESSSTESSLSNSSLETREESRPITPTSDDFNFSPIEDHLEENEDSPPMGGLSKRQIDMLTVRNFNESDASNSCTICIEEFREGNKIRTLPCSHTYHVHCIDSWLADNATCPVCRRRVRSDGREL
ncbi:E3 ubiquitin-protein ligase RNF12-A-like [Dipodomys spectabilis]|uniref:E3 ubiquitin-protein ligase RNF12-A-like n=1 Tax=Dipodomys spectabilis TaxID=105255 RepID=UPI001C541955|nr:E3 ubiquitin-protein ligase RNF12-A-like [Dipodomys spectabilis]